MSREEVHRMVDQLPDDRIEPVRVFLTSILNPRPDHPERATLHNRAREYRKQVEERFRQTRRPGTIGGMSGGGFSSRTKEGLEYSSHSFHYWDGKAIVFQTMRYFSGQEFEQMERMHVTEDSTQLLYEQELSSGGKTCRREEAFPIRRDP